MKKITLLLMMILAGFTSFGQECGTFIDLTGKGIEAQEEATLEIGNPGNVVSMMAEAIYKSDVAPSQVRFWTDAEEIYAEPVDIPISGYQPDDIITVVFRATFTIPAGEIHMDILDNEPYFYSFAAYVTREGGSLHTDMEGSLFHVYQNEDNPLITELPLATSGSPRDIRLRFGITELNDDHRWAIFTFEANGETQDIKIRSWDEAEGETPSYTIQEVLFEDVPGNVDKITMTMLSENYEYIDEETYKSGDSFIAGLVLVDTPCEYRESEGYCTYTQGFYGNDRGKTCKGESTSDLLGRLLAEDLVLGSGDHTFTIAAGGVDCVLELLPGGGPSSVLPGERGCSNMNDIEINKQGRLKNTLLAQGITLALNLRNSPSLVQFPIDGETFTVRMMKDCLDPGSGGIPGTEQSYSFPADIADYLGEGATIGDLLALVNSALAGEPIEPLTLSQVSDAATMVNEAFDECVVILGESVEDTGAGSTPEVTESGDKGDEFASGDESGDKGDEFASGDESGDRGDEFASGDESGDKGDEFASKGVTGTEDRDLSRVFQVYPNPASDRISISSREGFGNVQEIIIYSITGEPAVVMDRSQFSAASYVHSADLNSMAPGIYILRIRSEEGTFSQRISIR